MPGQFAKTVRARAIADFVARGDAELGFSKGDAIEISDRVNKDWYFGRLESGAAGFVPTAYVTKAASSAGGSAR